MSLAKISRKLRAKFGVGAVRLYGSEAAADSVVVRWREERDKNISKWKDSYDKGVRDADTAVMRENLSEWYRHLTMIGNELREAVTPIYAKAKTQYRQKKTRRPAPAIARI